MNEVEQLFDVLKRTNREFYLSVNHDPMKVTASLQWEVRLTIENNDGVTKKFRSVRGSLEHAAHDIMVQVATEMLGA
jgi:hypothetical protein